MAQYYIMKKALFTMKDEVLDTFEQSLIDFPNSHPVGYQRGETTELVILETKKELIARITKFHKSGESSLIIDDIPYETYLELFSDIKPVDVILGVRKLPDSVLILASKRQRGKISEYHRGTDFGNSTWNYDSICAGFISWITHTSIPVIKLNSSTLSEYGFLSKWDGESKALLKYVFINNPHTKLWKVLNGLEFTAEVKNFTQNLNRFTTDTNMDVVNKLNEMFLEFQKHQEIKTNENERTEFIDYEWIITNQYESLIQSILQLKPTIIIQNLPASTESEAYNREGKHGQEQTPIHLTNSQVKDAWYDFTRFDVNQAPKELFYETIKNSCFVEGDKVNPFYREINSDIFSKGQYSGKDSYIYDFILSNLMTIDSEKCSIEFGNVTSDNEFYRGIARPYDENGANPIQRNVKNYHKMVENCTSTKTTKVNNKIKEKFELIEHIFGLDKNNNILGGAGFRSKNICNLVIETQKPTGDLESIRTHIGKYGIIRKGSMGKFAKLYTKELEKIITIRVLEYFINNPSKFTNNSQITNVLQTIYHFVVENWINYVFKYEVRLDVPKEEKLPSYVPTYTSDEYKDAQNLCKNSTPLDKPIFGMLYGLIGGNLEKMFYVFDEFWANEVTPYLVDLYGDVSNTTKEMRDFKIYLRAHHGQSFVDDFKLYKTEGTETYGLSNHDIGHSDAESKGGLLRSKKWLAEEAKHNRYDYTTDSKDIEQYYRCLVANHNDNHQDFKLKYMETGDDEWFERVSEAKQCLNNLKVLLEYLELSELFDQKLSYINGTVEKGSYIVD